jgi:hypothetical protein
MAAPLFIVLTALGGCYWFSESRIDAADMPPQGTVLELKVPRSDSLGVPHTLDVGEMKIQSLDLRNGGRITFDGASGRYDSRRSRVIGQERGRVRTVPLDSSKTLVARTVSRGWSAVSTFFGITLFGAAGLALFILFVLSYVGAKF